MPDGTFGTASRPGSRPGSGLLLDELQVVSDLHLGGKPGFQIFASTAELVWLIDSVAQSPTPGLAALVVNGDFIDFLAEEPALGFDADGVLAKIDRVLADPSFAPVFAAFARLLATERRLLVVNLGNHDIELALPWAREHLARALAGDDAAARARLLLVTDGTGFRCQVGNASVLCLHGNEVDSWNVTDHEKLRRIGRDTQFGLRPEPWMPNAGSQLVVEVMNQVKARYPFVDLLKPETEGVVPILAALNPQLLRKLQDLTGIAQRKAVDQLRMRAGFLSADGDGSAAAGGAAPAATADSAAHDLPTVPSPPAFGASGLLGGNGGGASGAALSNAPPGSAAALLARAEAAYLQGVTPISLVQGSASEQLGPMAAAWDWLTGKPRAEVLREALEFLDKDRSFDPAAPDDTYKAIDALVSPDVDLVLTGHTHLERSLPRQRGDGHYFNSGTWARLMRISPELRQDPARFAQLFDLLDGQPVAQLVAASPALVMQRNSVVAIWRDAAGRTHAELRHVGPAAGAARVSGLAGAPGNTGAPGQPNFQATPVAGTRHTRG